LACDDIPRDNLLDPKNSDGYADQVVLVEAFVNTNPSVPFDYNQWAIAGLDNVLDFYPDEVVVAEYHRDVQTYDDALNTVSSNIRFTQLHQKYTLNADVPMGVPDIFVNGQANRISGASSASVVEEQVRTAASRLINEQNKFMIEIETEFSGAQSIKVNATIAAMGNKAASNISARLIFLKDYQEVHQNHVVIDLIDQQDLPDIEKGSFIEQSFDTVTFEQIPDRVVLSVISEDGTEVYQSAVKEL
jgi:hypothetical protein